MNVHWADIEDEPEVPQTKSSYVPPNRRVKKGEASKPVPIPRPPTPPKKRVKFQDE
jgi:hypothetical protein